VKVERVARKGKMRRAYRILANTYSESDQFI